jgi:hypothetical protein
VPPLSAPAVTHLVEEAGTTWADTSAVVQFLNPPPPLTRLLNRVRESQLAAGQPVGETTADQDDGFTEDITILGQRTHVGPGNLDSSDKERHGVPERRSISRTASLTSDGLLRGPERFRMQASFETAALGRTRRPYRESVY